MFSLIDLCNMLYTVLNVLGNRNLGIRVSVHFVVLGLGTQIYYDKSIPATLHYEEC